MNNIVNLIITVGLFILIGWGAWWLVRRIPDPGPQKFATYALIIIGLLILLGFVTGYIPSLHLVALRN